MKRRQFITSCLIFAAVPTLARAALPEIFTGIVEGVAVGGYDAVSYFGGAPQEGNPAHMTEWKGAKWYFATAENLAAFTASPEKYAPLYGGYCAYAVSKGYTAKGDPQAWTVVDDKLYLNYSLSVRDTWAKDIPGNIAKANANWPKVLE